MIVASCMPQDHNTGGVRAKLKLATVPLPAPQSGPKVERSDDRVTSIHHLDGGGPRSPDLRPTDLGRGEEQRGRRTFGQEPETQGQPQRAILRGPGWQAVLLPCGHLLAALPTARSQRGG